MIDVSKWTRFQADQRHPFWWGILGLIVIEATVLAGFIIAYFYLWIVNATHSRMSWPPADTPIPPLLLPTLECFLLFICGWTMWYGGIVMRKSKNKLFVWLVIICCVAGSMVLGLRWFQLAQIPYNWRKNAYASFMWFLTGFHFLHVTSAIVGTIVIGWLAYKEYYTEQRMLGIQVDTMYWYFVVAGWFPIYIVLYWAPRMV